MRADPGQTALPQRRVVAVQQGANQVEPELDDERLAVVEVKLRQMEG